MYKVFVWCVAVCVAVLLTWLPPVPDAAEATTFARIQIYELASHAELIVEATAREKQSLWLEGTLFTRVSLDVQRSLKGHAPSTVQVLLPGGIDLDRSVPLQVRWPGAPEIAPEETVLLFLRRILAESQGAKRPPQAGDPPGASPATYYSILGFSQGKLTIHQTPSGNRVVLGASISGETPRSLASVEREILAGVKR